MNGKIGKCQNGLQTYIMIHHVRFQIIDDLLKCLILDLVRKKDEPVDRTKKKALWRRLWWNRDFEEMIPQGYLKRLGL